MQTVKWGAAGSMRPRSALSRKKPMALIIPLDHSRGLAKVRIAAESLNQTAGAEPGRKLESIVSRATRRALVLLVRSLDRTGGESKAPAESNCFPAAGQPAILDPMRHLMKLARKDLAPFEVHTTCAIVWQQVTAATLGQLDCLRRNGQQWQLLLWRTAPPSTPREFFNAGTRE